MLLLVLVAGGIGLWVTRATEVDADRFTGLTGDAVNGKSVFTAAGCASCHHAPKSADKLVLAGGQDFASPFGTFYAPNISMDADHGIGDWTLAELASALLHGTSPSGQHYFPAFPYTAYSKLRDQQIADLWAYMQTLPADPTPDLAHDVGFPFNIRRGVGVWKILYLRDGWMVRDPPNEEITRGRELVEALAHCGECHTPRTALGGLKPSQWLSGAPNPTGKGTIPALTPDKLDWTTKDIAYYLETGFTPDFDSAGGHMVAVIENFSQLTPEDRLAVAAYLKALPASAE